MAEAGAPTAVVVPVLIPVVELEVAEVPLEDETLLAATVADVAVLTEEEAVAWRFM